MQLNGLGKFTESSRWIHVGFTNDSPNGESNLTKPKCRSWILVFSRKERKDRKAYRDGGVLQDFQARPLF